MRNIYLIKILFTTTALCAFAASTAMAANFTVANGVTETTAQSIGAGANETGTVEAGGTVATATHGVNAVTSSSVGGTIINNGTITSSTGAYAVVINNIADNTLINNGTIASAAPNAASILTAGDRSIITNNNTINGAGIGILISTTSDDSVITNGARGTITTSGTHDAINSSGTGNSLINQGTITTIDGMGLYSGTTATNNILTNSGSIVASGTGSAMRSDGTGVIITNAGYARSVGGDTVALNGANNTLVLKANSTVDGAVVYTGGGTSTLTYDVGNTGRGGSITRITGPVAVVGALNESLANIPAGMRAIQRGETVVVLTPDQFGGSNQVISQTVNDAGNVVNNRQQMALLGDTTEANGGTQYAASTSSTNDASNPGEWAVRDRKVAWAEAIGSYQERGQTSDTSDSKAKTGGVLAGVDLPQTADGIRSGYYVGGFGGSLDIGNFKDVSSAGGMAGGYVGKNFGEYYVSGGLNIGFSNNDSDRFTGIDTANSDYTSYFASPSITVMRPIQKNGYILVPSATIRYTAQRDGSYTETGSAANQSVDSRTSHSLDGRAMLEARFDGKKFENGNILKTALRAGVQGQTMIGSNKTDVTILGKNLSFDPDGGDNSLDGVLGVNLNLSHSEKLDLYFDGEANLGLNHGGLSNNKGIIGRLGAKWKL